MKREKVLVIQTKAQVTYRGKGFKGAGEPQPEGGSWWLFALGRVALQ